MKGKAGDGERGGADLGELDALRDPRFVVAVGEFAAEPRQEEERRDDGGAGERNQDLGIGAGDLGQNDEDECRLEEVVAERREELTHEQGRETARRHQGLKHRSPAVCLAAVPPPRRVPSLACGGGKGGGQRRFPPPV